MTPTPTPPLDLDIVTVSIALFSAFFGANAGTIAGTYAVIIVFAAGGAAYSAGSREPTTRWKTFKYGLLMLLLALGVTVPIAEGLHRWAGLESRWTLGPIAALVAARPEWVIEQLRALWARRSGQPTQGGQP